MEETISDQSFRERLKTRNPFQPVSMEIGRTSLWTFSGPVSSKCVQIIYRISKESVPRRHIAVKRLAKGQKRKSGEPYIIHPVAVTCILASYYMDHETLCAGLLHDTVEDTEYVTFESLERMFGPSVRAIVEGETKVSKVSSTVSQAADDAFVSSTFDEPDVNADDLQQMFLAMTERFG